MKYLIHSFIKTLLKYCRNFVNLFCAKLYKNINDNFLFFIELMCEAVRTSLREAA